MELLALTLGKLEENCYFLIDGQKKTLIFDPGAEPEEIKKVIEEEGLTPRAILLTHAHFDHIGAVEEIRNTYKIPVYMNEIEKDFLTDPTLNLSALMGEEVICKPADRYYPATMGDFKVGSFHMKLAHVPGHSPGSTVFIFEQNGFMIGGDVLFKGGCGRTDFPGGSHELLINGIKEKILPLPGNMVILPGHGDATTIQDEIATNPYLNGQTR